MSDPRASAPPIRRAYDFRCKQCGREYSLVRDVEPDSISCHDCATGVEVHWWRKRPAPPTNESIP